MWEQIRGGKMKAIPLEKLLKRFGRKHKNPNRVSQENLGVP
jgi:hypothetical protein